MKKLSNMVAVSFKLAATFLLFACTNSSEEIQKLAGEAEVQPLNVQKNVVYEYSDSSFKRLEIQAPEVLDFSHIDKPYMEFPTGIDVTFYNKLGEPESHLKSNYAKQFVDKQLWEARGDVVVVNEKGEQLNTEQLFWDTQKRIIYSNVFTKIVFGEEVMMGDGFEADQSFESYKLKGNVGGEIQFKEEADEEDAQSR